MTVIHPCPEGAVTAVSDKKPEITVNFKMYVSVYIILKAEIY
jgi:hypothetical protein